MTGELQVREDTPVVYRRANALAGIRIEPTGDPQKLNALGFDGRRSRRSSHR